MLFLIYVALTVIVIVAVSRNMNNEGYLIANRNLGTISTALSLTVSKFGGGLIIGLGSLIYVYGFSIFWFYIGFVFGYLSFYKFSLKLKDLSDKHKIYTMSDYYHVVHGSFIGNIASVLCFLCVLGLTCINLIGGANVIEKISAIPFEYALILMALFVGIYIALGGFRSVVATDVLQAGIIAICLCLFVFTFEKNQFSGLDFSLKTQQFLEPVVMFQFLFGFSFPFAMPDVWPRIYAIKEKALLKISLTLTAVCFSVFGFILTTLLLIIQNELPSMEPIEAIIKGFQELLPSYLGGAMLVFLFAAVMSSLDSFLFQANIHLVKDFHFLEGKSFSKNLKMRSNLAMIFVLVIGLFVAFTIPDIVKMIMFFNVIVYILCFMALLSWGKALSKTILCLLLFFGFVGALYGFFMHGISAYMPIFTAIFTLPVLPYAFYFKFKEKPKP